MKTMQLLFLPTLALAISLPLRADAPNLLSNGDFERMKNGVPVDWSIPENPGLVKTAFPVEQNRGSLAQVELLRTGDKGAYFSQGVSVKPHTRYRFSLLARLNKGKITYSVLGDGAEGAKKLNLRRIGEARTRLPMAPLFWNEEWYKNVVFDAGQWRPVSIEFDSGELSKVYVSFGAYFTAGTYSFDDAALVEIGPSAVNNPTAANN